MNDNVQRRSNVFFTFLNYATASIFGQKPTALTERLGKHPLRNRRRLYLKSTPTGRGKKVRFFGRTLIKPVLPFTKGRLIP